MTIMAGMNPEEVGENPFFAGIIYVCFFLDGSLNAIYLKIT